MGKKWMVSIFNRFCFSVSVIILGFPGVTYAGESGFWHAGTETITYRDGKKIGPSLAEYLKKENLRRPASEEPATPIIHFERQGGPASLTCFVPENRAGISCSTPSAGGLK